MKNIKNKAHSVRVRLLAIAKTSGRRFDAVALQYVQERFLFRISISRYKSNFVLKGALLLLVNDISRFRPTRDIDFLGYKIENTMENIITVIKEIASLDCNYGLAYISESVQCEVIKEGADYEGKRVTLDVHLGSMQNKLQLDIGFGDKTFLGPREIIFPALLADPAAHIFSYPLESVIAEKIEAIVKLNFFTSRIKDFYDIYFMATLQKYSLEQLHMAMQITFNNRGTHMDDFENIVSPEFVNDANKAALWDAFIRKNALTISYVNTD